STNTFDTNARAILLFNVDQSMIHNNRMTNSTLVGSGDIRIFGGVDGLMITNNDMSGGAGWAIRMTNVDNVGPSSDIVIHENNIANYAGSGGMFGGGLFVGADAYPGTLAAACTCWDDPCGPSNLTNTPLGPGQEVQEAMPSNVDFSPWLIAPGPAPMSEPPGTCSGTADTCRATTTTTTTPPSTVPTTTTTPVTP